MSELNEKVKEALATVPDPHMGISIVEMGLVQNIGIEKNDETVAKITIKPTNPGCMSVARIAQEAKKAVESVKGVDKVEIDVNGHMMSEAINEMINK